MQETLRQRPGAEARDPLWYKDAIIYELHVKAFYDSVDDGIGDFAGVIQKLDYLQELGVTAIWLLPFYPSPMRDDGYDIADYYEVHPDFGTLKDLKHLIRQAHQRGLRVITELVINHTSDQHPWFQRARLAPKGSPERDYYVWSDTDDKYRDVRIIFSDTEKSNWTWDPVAQAYYWHRFFSHQPDLNFDNPLVRRSVIKVLRFWLEQGVDGFRLDAIPYLIEREGTDCTNLPETHAFLRELRRDMDRHKPDGMLVAEANCWPSEVLAYFGDGDECHMAFHFPLMPRLFMAVRQEDRHPITEIFRQTPPIPEECQWALFLRNHDELTLEMVTDEERDYMYREYAADPKMRINLGIRRRLAPLMECNQRRMELLNSLLLSFPGTPVIYYGDEIGMGDNVYLGDRNGVRTPMQWTGDRNAGFSKADPARLYSPVVMDPLTGYQAVNVEAQQRNPSSILNFMKRMIALRKRHRTFGRGSIDFLHPQNRKVLAYVRRYEGEAILCVANLSRFVQPVELDLSALAGATPIEMIGKTEFPRIGEAPYFLTIGPHGFYWFLLRDAPVRGEDGAPRDGALPRLTVAASWDELLAPPLKGAFERFALAPYLHKQAWFPRQSIKAVRVLDVARLDAQARPLYLMLVQARRLDGEVETYAVPLAVVQGAAADALRQTGYPGVLAELTGPEGEALLVDALAEDASTVQLLGALETGQTWTTPSGAQVVASPRGALAEFYQGPPDAEVRVTRPTAEMRNTVALFSSRRVLKLFRRVERGPHPEVELLERFETLFSRAPRLGGTVDYRLSDGAPIVLAVIEEFLPNEGSGADYVQREVGQFLEFVADRHFPPAFASQRVPLVERLGSSPPGELGNWMGGFPGAAAILGQRIAEMHRALASSTGNQPTFRPEPFAKKDQLTLARRIGRQVKEAIKLLRGQLEQVRETDRHRTGALLNGGANLVARLTELADRPLEGRKIRLHGKLQLGDVLRREGDFLFIDFEGDPTLPLDERREKGSPLEDVATLLRSLRSVAYRGLLQAAGDQPEELARLQPWIMAWLDWATADVLQSYLTAAETDGLLPTDRAESVRWLEAYLLEQSSHELIHELQRAPAEPSAVLAWMLSDAEGESRPAPSPPVPRDENGAS